MNIPVSFHPVGFLLFPPQLSEKFIRTEHYGEASRKHSQNVLGISVH